MADGHVCVGDARITGDGHNESCILDVEGDRIEITMQDREGAL